MKKLDLLTMVLLIVGGLNWGLVGALEFDLVAALFGEMSLLSRVVYILVGLSAVYQAVQWSAVRRRSTAYAGAAAVALGLLAAPAAQAQEPTRAFVEARAGFVVPTFEIADVATAGPAFGATIGYQLSPRWVVMGEFDYGMHEAEADSDIDITTMHYVGKVGYSLTGPRELGWEALVNLGAGAVTFDVDAPGAEANTYLAINAGAKIAYNFSRSLAVVLSPQGDIAFTDEDEVGTTNAWVWPVTAGVRVKF